MRKLKAIDLISFSYCMYLAITLFIDRELFDSDITVYYYFKQINPHEFAWGMTAFIIGLVYVVAFLVYRKWLFVLASGLSGLYFITIGSAYMVTYPNMGSGIFTIIGIVCFLNIGDLVITEEHIRKVEIEDEIERKINNSDQGRS